MSALDALAFSAAEIDAMSVAYYESDRTEVPLVVLEDGRLQSLRPADERLRYRQRGCSPELITRFYERRARAATTATGTRRSKRREGLTSARIGVGGPLTRTRRPFVEASMRSAKAGEGVAHVALSAEKREAVTDALATLIVSCLDAAAAKRSKS